MCAVGVVECVWVGGGVEKRALEYLVAALRLLTREYVARELSQYGRV